MDIDIQIKSLLFSFIYGILFSIFLNYNQNNLYKSSLIIRIIMNIVFIIDNALIYFIVLKHINNGILHIYFILMLITGYITNEILFKKNTFAYKQNR